MTFFHKKKGSIYHGYGWLGCGCYVNVLIYEYVPMKCYSFAAVGNRGEAGHCSSMFIL